MVLKRQSPEVEKILRDNRKDSNDPQYRASMSTRAIAYALIAVLVVVSGLGASLFVAVRAQTQTVHALTQTVQDSNSTVSRTECVRDLNNIINDKRWGALGVALSGVLDKSRAEVVQGVSALNGLKGETTEQIAKLCPGPVVSVPTIPGLSNVGTTAPRNTPSG